MKHAPSHSLARPINEVPNFITPAASQMLGKLNEFQFDEDDPEDKDLPTFGPFIFKDKSIYYGKWKNGMRHGRGV